MGHKIFMTKGDGDHGYHNNSYAQRSVTDGLIFPVLDEAIHHISLPTGGSPIVVADLGCSSGSNAISDIEYVVKLLRSRSGQGAGDQAVQAYFTDLRWNDFNHLFKTLSEREGKPSNFYASGVPGSFHGRLFPQSFVHIFISMFSPHFISKIPDSVTQENSPAFNRGNLWLHGATDATASAYAEQFSRDLKAFLQARSEELAPGGMLCFLIKTRQPQKANDLRGSKDSVDAVQLCLHETAEQAISKDRFCPSENFLSIAAWGYLSQQRIDSHNAPMYYPLKEEALKIVESFGSSFDIHAAKEQGYPLFAPPNPKPGRGAGDDEAVVRTAVKFIRALLGGMMEDTMGADEGLEFFWEHYAQNAKKHITLFRQDCQYSYIVLLKK